MTLVKQRIRIDDFQDLFQGCIARIGIAETRGVLVC